MPSIEDRYKDVSERISTAASNSGRKTDEIQLLGVSKKQHAEKILAAHSAGLKEVGENYLQEALAKQEQLSTVELNWHFIGPIQSNKCRMIARHFSWVHSVDRLKIARKLNECRSDAVNKLNILLQINIDNEASKSGFLQSELEHATAEILELPHLDLRGLMVIPKVRETLSEQRAPFAATRLAMETLNRKFNLKMDTLSMGMSNDLEAAIAEGATIVRIGTALFGARTRDNTN
jgi:pyridoxal phosphate enzyme (YggS family)